MNCPENILAVCSPENSLLLKYMYSVLNLNLNLILANLTNLSMLAIVFWEALISSTFNGISFGQKLPASVILKHLATIEKSE